MDKAGSKWDESGSRSQLGTIWEEGGVRAGWLVRGWGRAAIFIGPPPSPPPLPLRLSKKRKERKKEKRWSWRKDSKAPKKKYTTKNQMREA